MRVLDLFSGIGGFSLGLERAGMQTVAFCEMKPHARAVLAKNFPGVPCHDDVTTYDFQQGEAEIITAGFPCQDISFAGEGAGLAGARSGLYRHVIRALRMVRPRYAVLENVSALLSRGLDTVLGDVAEVGYDAEWHCIPASAVGAPHRRDRIWIIADAGSQQHESNRAPFSGEIAAQLSIAAADAAAMLGTEVVWSEQDGDTAGIGEMADTESQWQHGSGTRPQSPGRTQSPNRGWWSAEPDVGRVANGIPARVDRLSELGNAVVPLIPEIIGRAIMKCAQTSR